MSALILNVEFAKDGSAKLTRIHGGQFDSSLCENVMDVSQRLQDHADLGYKIVIRTKWDESDIETYCPVQDYHEMNEERE